MRTQSALTVFSLATLASLAGAVNLAIWPVLHCFSHSPRWQKWIHYYSVKNSNSDICILSSGYNIVLVVLVSTSACLKRGRKSSNGLIVALLILTPVFQVRPEFWFLAVALSLYSPKLLDTKTYLRPLIAT